MKRFYKDVSVKEESGAFRVLLDSRTLKTPAKNDLILPTRKLAQAVADEWSDQLDKIDLQSMKFTKFANTALDVIPTRREAVVDHILSYGKNDLVCYRADGPPELVQRQAEAWDPILSWIANKYGAIFAVTSGISSIEQPTESLTRLRAVIEERNDFGLAALQAIASITGSLILTLALAERHIRTTAAFVFSRIDETWQAEKWGDDAEAKARAGHLFSEFGAAQIFLSLSA